MQGLRALIPFEHVKSYRRSARITRPGSAGKAGAFALLLERHPELEALIVSELRAHHVVVRQRGNGRLFVSGLGAQHKHLRQLCLELGLTERDYPLVQAEQGIRSLAAAVKSIAMRSFEEAASAALTQKRSGAVRLHTDGLPLVSTQRYDAVEFDGHRVDVRLRVVFEQAAGIEESFEIERVWLLTIIDVCSRAVLGYHIVLEPEYSHFAVLKTVERALVSWSAPTLTIPGLRYAPGAGMPSERFPELGYAVWNWFRFDNARANLAEDTLRVLTEVVGCGAHAGPAYRPNERPHIERFFGTLASVLAHRHQIRSFACCLLHGLRLRGHCLRCGKEIAYELGKSTVLGPINCSSCRAPLLPVSRGGFPEAGMVSVQTQALIARWMAFLERRIKQPVLFEAVGVIDVDRVDRTGQRERMQVCIQPRSVNKPITPLRRARSSADATHRCLEWYFGSTRIASGGNVISHRDGGIGD